MRRRELLAGAVAFTAWRSQAQSADLPLVGALFVNVSATSSAVLRMLVADMRTLGYMDGSTVRYAVRASEDPVRLSELATELVELVPQVIYANGDVAAKAVAAATMSIPIVAMTDDHIGAGLTDSLARPSRNVTGISRLEADLDTKRLELLHELVPVGDVILALRDPQTTFPSRTTALEQAASRSGIKLEIRDIRAGSEIDEAIATGRAAGAKAVLVLGSPLLTSVNVDEQIARAAAAHHLATMVQIPSMVNRGHLAGYGVNQDTVVFRLSHMIEEILRGTPLRAIPIEQPTKFEFFLSLKTANALGLTIPPSILARADEVIE